MKALLASPLLFMLPVALWAQTASSVERRAGHVEIKNKAKARPMASESVAAAAVLTPAELAIAQRVHVGKLPCELGASVTLAADPHAPGYFQVQLGKLKFHMAPVETTTGAIRLEDRKAGTVWLQLANKSMLLNHKLGQRLADACMNPAQLLVADVMEKNPTPSVLDAPAGRPGPLAAGPAVALK